MAEQSMLAYDAMRSNNREWVQSNLTDAYKRVTGHDATMFDIDEAVIVAENENGIFAVKDGVYIGSKPIGSIFTVTTFPFPRKVSEKLWLDWQEDEEPTDLAMKAAESWAEKACSRLHISSCAGKDHRELLKRMLHMQPVEPTGSAATPAPATAPKPAESATPESAGSAPAAADAPTNADHAVAQSSAPTQDHNAGTQAVARSLDLNPEKIEAGDARAPRRRASKATPESATAPVPQPAHDSLSLKPDHADTRQHAHVGSAADSPDSTSLPKLNNPETLQQAAIGSAAGSTRAQGNRINGQLDTQEQGFSIISMPPSQPAAQTSGAAQEGGVGNVVNPAARIGDSARTQPIAHRQPDNPGRPTQSNPINPGRPAHRNTQSPGRPTAGRPTQSNPIDSGRPTQHQPPNPGRLHPDRPTKPTPSPDRNPAQPQGPDNESSTQPERKAAMSQKERSSQAPKSKCFVVMASGAKGAKPVMVLTEQEDALDMAEALEAANAVLAESPAYDVVEAILRH